MTKRERKEVVKSLYRAAERVETDSSWFCCWAIGDERTRNIFEELFLEDAIRLHKKPYDGAWFQEVGESGGNYEVRSRRVLGLLFCAHLTEIGELPWEEK